MNQKLLGFDGIAFVVIETVETAELATCVSEAVEMSREVSFELKVAEV